MATIIHHGGGVGTFKSFSSIQNHAIPQLKAGRTIVSTIRGFDSIEKVEEALDIELPPDAEIIYVDCEKATGRKKIKTWWHWVPRGAFIIIDEAQKIYPKRLKLDTLDYPSRTVEKDGQMVTLTGEECADLDQRPFTFEDAFDEQRHYNWDLILITPNIAKINSEMRGVAQTAYRHKNMSGIAPWKKNKWREFNHDATDTGKTSVRTPKEYKADKRIFDVYRSTKTGAHTDSGAEKSILSDWKVSVAGILILVCFSYIGYNLYSRFSDEDIPVSGEVNAETVNQISPVAVVNNDHFKPVNQVGIKNDDGGKRILKTTYFDVYTQISILGQLGYDYLFEFGVGDNAYQLTSTRLIRAGYKVKHINDCRAEIYTPDDIVLDISCALHRRHFRSKKASDSSSNNIALSVANPFQAVTNSAN